MFTSPLRTARRLAVLVSAALMIPMLSSPPASAVAATNASGRPGAVTVTLPMITGYDLSIPSAGNPRMWETKGMVVGRSAGSTGTQTVSARYVLQKSANGGWTNYFQSGDYSGTITGNGTLRFPSWTATPASQPINATGYRFVYHIVWSSTSTGAVLGAESVYPNRNGENACHTIVRRCTAYYDGIVF
jgi:hypothetical protein